jgi:hypothetical protein
MSEAQRSGGRPRRISVFGDAAAVIASLELGPREQRVENFVATVVW